MAAWPGLAELKQKLNVETDDWDTHLGRLLTACIEQVQIDIGEQITEPDESLAHAALVLAVGIGTNEGESAVPAAARLPNYQRLLKGHRVRFGIA